MSKTKMNLNKPHKRNGRLEIVHVRMRETYDRFGECESEWERFFWHFLQMHRLWNFQGGVYGLPCVSPHSAA